MSISDLFDQLRPRLEEEFFFYFAMRGYDRHELKDAPQSVKDECFAIMEAATKKVLEPYSELLHNAKNPSRGVWTREI